MNLHHREIVRSDITLRKPCCLAMIVDFVFQTGHDPHAVIKKWCLEHSREGDENDFLPAFRKIRNVSDETKAFNHIMDKAREDIEDDWSVD
jgi:hypothetical protein